MANLCALATIFSNIAYGFGWPVFALGLCVTVLLYAFRLIAIAESEKENDLD